MTEPDKLVQRFHPEASGEGMWLGAFMEESDDGGYVRYEDFAAAIARAEQAERERDEALELAATNLRLADGYRVSRNAYEEDVARLQGERDEARGELAAKDDMHQRSLAVALELNADALRYRMIRAGLSDVHGDCYAMTFAGDGDYPVSDAKLDEFVDRMIERAALASPGAAA